MKKRVIIMANDTTYVYSLRTAIIKEIIKKNYEVYVVAEVKLFEKELTDMGCHIINVKLKRKTKELFSNIKLLISYKRIIRNIKPDYILAYNIKPDIYCGLIIRKNDVKFMPNVTGLGKALAYKSITQKILIKLLRISFKNASVVFFQNKNNRDFFKNNKIIKEDMKTVLLPGSGVDLNVHKVLPYPQNKTIKLDRKSVV